MDKFNPHHKRVEIETLIEDIFDLKKQGKIRTTDNLIPELIAEGGKKRGSTKSKVLDQSLREAAKQLKSNEDIVIRRADKASIYVLLSKEEYNDKMNAILNDKTKFQRIRRDPTATLKIKVNKIINALLQK